MKKTIKELEADLVGLDKENVNLRIQLNSTDEVLQELKGVNSRLSKDLVEVRAYLALNVAAMAKVNESCSALLATHFAPKPPPTDQYGNPLLGPSHEPHTPEEFALRHLKNLSNPFSSKTTGGFVSPGGVKEYSQ